MKGEACYDHPRLPLLPSRRPRQLPNAMSPDLTRTLAATAFVASVIALVLLGASGCQEFAAYVACACLAIMAAFVGSTQQI